MTPKQLRTLISANIRERRKLLHLNQVALASACACTQAQISALEKGKSGCSDEMLAKLSQALHCHPAALLMESAYAENLKIGA